MKQWLLVGNRIRPNWRRCAGGGGQLGGMAQGYQLNASSLCINLHQDALYLVQQQVLSAMATGFIIPNEKIHQCWGNVLFSTFPRDAPPPPASHPILNSLLLFFIQSSPGKPPGLPDDVNHICVYCMERKIDLLQYL